MTAQYRIAAATLTFALAAIGTLAAQSTTPDAQKHPTPAADRERTIPAAQVPAPVREAFRRAYPSATVLRYITERENGQRLYEVVSREGTTRRDLDISPEGRILETETQQTPAQLPAAVRTAAEANGAHIQIAELVVAGRDTTYEIKIRGRKGELKLTADGRSVPATQH
ncbi:MAG: PepSY-like domain-containing protein [Candidatus Binatia bacterium]